MAVSHQPPPTIFISHSHIDDGFCLKLVEDLRQAVGDADVVWYDAAGGLKGGDVWWQNIVIELRARPIFLVILSPAAMASPWVNDEINLAWNFKNTLNGRRIIPIFYQPCYMRADLGTIQGISFLPPRSYQEALDELLRVIREPVLPARGNLVPLGSTSASPAKKRRTMLLWLIASSLVVLALLSGSFFWLFPPSATKSIQAGPENNNGTNQARSGTQPCPSPANTTKYWSSILDIKNDSQGLPEDSIDGIYCANLEGNASLQALILDRSLGSAAFLSVDVYDKITSAHPALVFQQGDLLEGSARISARNTVITAAVDSGSTVNKSAANHSEYKQDLFQEYQWSNQQHRFVQGVFDGIFPDLTRWQAENDQKSVDSGIDSWKLDAKQTAQHFVSSLLQWSINTSAILVNGGGKHDLSAVVKLGSDSPSGLLYQLTLRRLNDDVSGGIWEVTDASYEPLILRSASNIPIITKITQPAYGNTASSPFQVKGRCDAFTTSFGTIKVLDHLYNMIGSASVVQDGVDPLSGNRTYYANVNYHSTSPHEEGIVALYINGPGNSTVGAIMTKVILD